MGPTGAAQTQKEGRGGDEIEATGPLGPVNYDGAPICISGLIVDADVVGPVVVIPEQAGFNSSSSNAQRTNIRGKRNLAARLTRNTFADSAVYGIGPLAAGIWGIRNSGFSHRSGASRRAVTSA